ncbi:MAG: hypothetical protein HY692_10015 [Cyanobacteria bacterium NC_groundwater_1444_Ag_S-0.65um_54_12]|nr:hypothetical protein [Cyanobacteria bacterium NC_groundwater_1444_Ag_S-0.65um_54_12]
MFAAWKLWFVPWLAWVLIACDSTRMLIATTDPESASSTQVLKARLRPPIPPQPATLFLETGSLPAEVASASVIALVAEGTAYPMVPASGYQDTLGRFIPLAVWAASVNNLGAILPRSDGTVTYALQLDRRVVRTFTATVSFVP